MKKIFVIIMTLVLGYSASAQMKSSQVKTRKAVGIGVIGGGNLASFTYLGDHHQQSSLDHSDIMSRLRPVAGLTVDIPFGFNMYVSPEILYVGRGDARQYVSATSGQDMSYKAVVNYLDVRVPLAMSFPVSDIVHPYVFAAPTFGMVLGEVSGMNLGGTLSMNDTEIPVGTSNMSPFDFGVLAGAGLRFNFDFSHFSLVAKLEVDYNMGLINTYSYAELHDEAHAMNVNAYNVNGIRTNRGLECLFSLILPLKFQGGDACSNWSKSVYPSSKGNTHFGF